MMGGAVGVQAPLEFFGFRGFQGIQLILIQEVAISLHLKRTGCVIYI